MFSSRLDPDTRQRAIDALAHGETVDVLVVGGGITGAGIALDAASRGLTVALIESGDLAGEDSSRTTRLVHGGAARLEWTTVARVAEALQERSRLADAIAPHLVQRQPLLMPLRSGPGRRALTRAVFTAYDALSVTPAVPRTMPFHRRLDRAAAHRALPVLRMEGVSGAVRCVEGRIDDTRLVLSLARTAAAHGGRVVSRMRAVSFLSDRARVAGVRAVDELSGRMIHVHARDTVLAVGARTESVLRMPGAPVVAATEQDEPMPCEPTRRGVRLLVPRDRIPGGTGVLTRTEGSRLTILPLERSWSIEAPAADLHGGTEVTPADVAAVLAEVHRVLDLDLEPGDVIAAEAGPHLADVDEPGGGSRHRIEQPSPGLTSVSGGSLTAYRVRAALTVDAALGHRAPQLPSQTARLPLHGAASYRVRVRQRGLLAQRYGWGEERLRHLLERYGDAIDEVVELIEADPTLAEPVAGAEEHLAAEIVHAVRFEGAMTLADVLRRRTLIALEHRERGGAALEDVATIMARAGGWDEERRRSEISDWRRSSSG